MHKKILHVLFAVLLMAALTLGTALPVSAEADDPNTIASSTMVFEGPLTPDGSGGYIGTIAMIDENGTGYGDGESGFDVYAKNGEIATYYDGTEYVAGTVVDNDAYTTAGGWGSFYDPDCADWDHYQLSLTGSTWDLQYNNSPLDGTPVANPMSGSVDWDAMYALETGAGSYYGGQGTPQDDGYALNNDDTGTNDGAGAWDMDWSWGSDYVPLQYPGFDITVEDIGGGNYRVTMVPASASSTQMEVTVEGILAIQVNPTSVDFGTLWPGQTSPATTVTVENIGNVQCSVDASVSPTGTVFDNLQLDSSPIGSWTGISSLAAESNQGVSVELAVPSGYNPQGAETAALVFTASAD